MAGKVEVAAQININAKDTGGSVKSIKTELREAKAEAIEMARKFGDTSIEANNAAKKLALLKNEVKDLGMKLKGVNPDKFARIAAIGQSVAQGFVAAQGAMAMFGLQSESVEKTMMKLQGAIALSQGLQGLKDAQIAFGGLATVIRTNVVAAFSTLKGAIVSTGIGALVVVLGIVAAKLMEMAEATDVASESQKTIQDMLEKSADRLRGLATSAESAKIRFQLAMGGITKEQSDKMLQELKFNETAKSLEREKNKDLLAIKEAYDKDVAKGDKSSEVLKQELFDGLKARETQFNTEMVALREEFMFTYLAVDKEAENERKEKAEEAKKEKVKEAKEAQQREIDLVKKANEELKKEQDDAQEKIISDAKSRDDADKIQANDRLEWNKNQNNLAEEEEKRTLDEVSRLQKIADDEQKERDEYSLLAKKELVKLKFELIKGGLQALSDIAYLFEKDNEQSAKKAFDIQKALSTAQAVISTIESAQAAFTSGVKNPLANLIPGGGIALGIAQAAIATAAGLARIKQIQNTKFNSTTSPSNESTPGGRGSIPTPSVNPTPQQQRNIVGNQTGSTGTQTQTNKIRVYVTETDISTAQNRVNGIKRRALVH